MPQPQEAILLRHLRKLATAHRATSDTDRDLLQCFIAGDEAAFAAVVQRHGAMVLGVCRSVLGHQQDAEDVFQATFLVLARKAGAIRKQESLSSWLHGVACRLALKARSQAGKRRAANVPAPRQPAASPLDDLSVREWQSILHEELHRLPEKYRTPLLLCYWEGKTRDEAADQLGWARGTLKEHLERGRNLLRSRLVRRGLIPSAALFTALFTQNAGAAGIAQALVQATARAGVAFAGKSSSAGAISGSAALLAEGALKAMQVSKWATTFLGIFFLTTLAGGIGLLSIWTPGGPGQALVHKEQAKKPALEPAPVPDARNQEPPDTEPQPDQKPKDLPAPAKDSDAGRWLTENLDAFEFRLGMSAKSAPPPLIFVTKETDPKDGINADYFVVKKEEAASIVQTLVDSGLWGRPQEYPEPGPTGRYMTLTPARWTWTLGRADEDVSTRFIVRHLLKISTGEREKKLKAWLAHGVMAAPVPAELKPSPLVRQVGAWHGDVNFVTPVIAMNGNQLARFFEDKALAARIAEKVDFEKERLVGFTWTGASDMNAEFLLSAGAKGKVCAFMRVPGLRLDDVPNSFLYAVSNDVSCSIDGVAPPKFDVPIVREVELGPFADVAQNKQLAENLRRLGDVQITDADDLARAFPDEPWQMRIARQVDFAKQRLVVFSWDGRASDKFTPTILDEAIAPHVQFQLTPGPTKDERYRFHVYALARAVSTIGLPRPPKVFVRPFGVTQVDFAKEYLLYFAWRGVGDDRLDQIDLPGKDGPIAFFRHHPGGEEKVRSHHRLFALPIGMSYRTAGPKPWNFNGVNAPREIELYMFEAPLWARDPSTPTRITSAAEAAKVFKDKTWFDFVTGRVNFDDEHLLYFAWSGNGDQKLSCKLEDVNGLPTAVFQHRYRSGEDKSRYVRLYVVPFNDPGRAPPDPAR